VEEEAHHAREDLHQARGDRFSPDDGGGSCSPIIPITIRGTREILPADSWLPAPGPIAVGASAPIVPEGDGWPAIVSLRDRTRAEILRRSGEPAADRHLTPSRETGDRSDQ
jgi:1-acyl-sn-glycerol-3-phosphate acyltransferase